MLYEFIQINYYCNIFIPYHPAFFFVISAKAGIQFVPLAQTCVITPLVIPPQGGIQFCAYRAKLVSFGIHYTSWLCQLDSGLRRNDDKRGIHYAS